MFGLSDRELLLLGGGALLALIVLFVVVKSLFGGGGKKQRKARQVTLRENLEEYPEAPPASSGRILLVDGVEARLRLVVMAPAGTQRRSIEADDVAPLLDDFVRGLGAIMASDKPRVRIWPPQLSTTGFAPTFFRLVESPDALGDRSHWVRLAGSIRVGGEPYLLGMALWTDDVTRIGSQDLAPNKWADYLKVVRG